MKKSSFLAILTAFSLIACNQARTGFDSLKSSSISQPPVFDNFSPNPALTAWKTNWNMDYFVLAWVSTSDTSQFGKLSLVAQSNDYDIAKVIKVTSIFRSPTSEFQTFAIQIKGGIKTGSAAITLSLSDQNGGNSNKLVSINNLGAPPTKPQFRGIYLYDGSLFNYTSPWFVSAKGAYGHLDTPLTMELYDINPGDVDKLQVTAISSNYSVFDPSLITVDYLGPVIGKPNTARYQLHTAKTGAMIGAATGNIGNKTIINLRIADPSGLWDITNPINIELVKCGTPPNCPSE